MNNSPQREQTLCIMGLGYIGLPTAALLATHGFQVCGVDCKPEVVEGVRRGEPHISEPELSLMLAAGVAEGLISAGTEPKPADVFLIAVPTPLNDHNEPILDHVADAVHAIAPVLQPGNLVIVESTCPVGTTEELVAGILQQHGYEPGDDLFLAYCPERVLPGRILLELIENDRIVGGINDASTEAATRFYEQFVRGDVIGTTARTAELVKLTENSFRDTNIAFANEISMISASEGVNAWEVIELANRHPRVNLLSPGPGVGGHCIAVDPWFIVHRSPTQSRLIRTAREVNSAKPAWVLDRIRASAARYKAPRIACLGLTFKADVDDLRESPAFEIVETLRRERVGELFVCEPNLRQCGDLQLYPLREALQAADIVVLLVDHRQFRKLSAAELNDKVVIDTRGIIR